MPSGLAGVDIAQLLDEAESVTDLLADDDEANPALRLGAAMAGTEPLRDKLVLVDDGSGMIGFADWAEQLIAESTGKNGTGMLPVVVGDPDDPDPEVAPRPRTSRWPGWSPTSRCRRAAGGSRLGPSRSEVLVSGSLGAQLLLWEVATAAAGRLLGINPFDQPDVESAKKAARGLLEATGAGQSRPMFNDGAVEVRSSARTGWATATTVPEPWTPCTRSWTRSVAMSRSWPTWTGSPTRCWRAPSSLATSTGRPTTFGWGPRFLHSTGQYHKGGPATGVYLQITTTPHDDLDVPGREFTFGRFIEHRRAGRTGAGRPRSPSPATAPDRPRCRPGAAHPGARHRRVRHRVPSPTRLRRANPLRDPRDKRIPRIAGPCGMVLFGVTGDLARKKLMPAVYDLANRGLLPPGFSLVGFARRDWADQDFGDVGARVGQEHVPHPVPGDGVAQPRRGTPFRARHVRR